jgi:dihydroflavonol-4-reductase
MIFGDRDIKPTPSGQVILDFLNGKLPGYFGGGINIVDADDVARGIIVAAQKGRIGERYILGGTNLSYKELFDMVAEIAGIKPITQKFSRSTLITMACLMKFISFFTRKPPAMNPVDMRILVNQDLFYDCSKAMNEPGYQTTPIKTTFEKAINWFQKNGYVKVNAKA